jgi:ADP-heptose:LPS heptosyltransferase
MADYRAEAGMNAPPRRILIVKLGALGNVVLSFGPFAAIRRHHADAHITLLTTAPYADWLATSPWFDQVWIDVRPEWWQVPRWLALRRKLIGGHFDRVYDMQTSTRSGRYFDLMLPGPRPEWSGVAFGCSLPDRDPNRDSLHDVDRQFGQLRAAGIERREPPDTSWTERDITRFGLPQEIALLVPGSSAHRLAKRWPAERYAALATALAARGVTPVILGSATEQPLAREIQQEAPGTIDLTGRTSLPDICGLARAARLAVGNDTGPMHLIAAACRSIVLFSRDSDPELCAPRGPQVTVLRRDNLADLDVATVLRAVEDEAAIAPAA